MIKREAKFTELFRHYLKAHPMYSAAFELKQTIKDYISFNVVKEHQVDALMAAKTKGILYKIPDDSIGIKPFDMVYLKNSPAYVVIKYPNFFCIIDIETFLLEKQRSKKKSLSSSRAKEISIKSIILK